MSLCVLKTCYNLLNNRPLQLKANDLAKKTETVVLQESNMRYALKPDDNYYELLNISADASMSEVYQAYELALQTFQEDSLFYSYFLQKKD